MHTLGKGDVNSGVRLSTKKFEKILEVIRDTYVLNNDVDGQGSPQPKPAIAIPIAAQGHEAIYERFLNGALIYRPTKGSDAGMVTLPIRELANPLEGTFDLSGCGDTGKYLSISTGYRKEKKPENASKVEVWIAPQFLIEKEIGATAAHFKPIMESWSLASPVGLFWTSGDWSFLGWYDYLTSIAPDRISNSNLYELWKSSSAWRDDVLPWALEVNAHTGISCFAFNVT